MKGRDSLLEPARPGLARGPHREHARDSALGVPGIVLLVTALALVLRIVGLNGQLWFDEFITVVDSVRPPFRELVTTYTSDNQHTLYALSAKAAAALFGEVPWALRLPAMLAGTLSVPMLYALGRAVASRREALAAALLLAVSYHHIWFSQNARGYTGLLLATLAATWCFITGLRRPGWRPWILYSVAMALGAYVHLTIVFVALSHLIVLAVLASRAALRREPLRVFARPLAGIAGAGALTLMLYGPALPELAAHFLHDSKETTPSEWTKPEWATAVLRGSGDTTQAEWKKPTWAIAETFRGLRFGYGAIGLAAAAVLGAAGCLRYLRKNPALLLLLVLPGLLGFAGVFAFRHNIWPRFLMYALGFALLILVGGAARVADALTRLAPRARRDAASAALYVSLIGAMVVASAVSLRPLYLYPKQDFLGALEFIEKKRRPDDAVVTVGLAALPYIRYYGAPWTPVVEAAQLDEILARGRRTWLVYTFPIHLRSQHSELAERIDRSFRSVKTFPATIGGGQLQVLVADPEPSRGMRPKPPHAPEPPPVVSGP